MSEYQRVEGGRGFANPGVYVERADFAEYDYDFDRVPRFITCSDDGTLVVDTADGEEEVTIQVFYGYNPIRITRIYADGSSAITVEGWR